MSAAEQLPSPRQILKDVFGYDSFRAGQEQAIAAVLAGRNVLTVMPTGSGKSLCFQVPALVLGGLTVVVSPLVALMQDQVAARPRRSTPRATVPTMSPPGAAPRRARPVFSICRPNG